VETPLDQRPRRSVRMDAALDQKTRAKLEDLATAFHRSRAAVLRQVMRWGLGREPAGPIDDTDPSPVQHLFSLVDAALHQQVRAAAKDAGVDVAPWVRHRMCQITRRNFPKSWQARTTEGKATAQRSHDSRYYGKRFMLRLDDQTWVGLEALARHFGEPNAEVIRQLIAQAKLEHFPPSWQLAVKERRQRQARREP
jgi:predicted transcriptional regulator